MRLQTKLWLQRSSQRARPENVTRNPSSFRVDRPCHAIEHPAQEGDFARGLSSHPGDRCGLRDSWFRTVEKLSWDRVGRLRTQVQYTLSDNHPWCSIYRLYDEAMSLADRVLELDPLNPSIAALIWSRTSAAGAVMIPPARP